MVKTQIITKLVQREGLTVLKNLLLQSGLLVSSTETNVVAHDFYDAVIKVRRKPGAEQMRLGVVMKSSGVPRFLFEFAGEVAMNRERNLYPVFVAPYISERGAEILRFHKIGFCDLAGNAHLETDMFLVSRKGSSNPAPKRKEVRSLFAPKATRIIRAMLLDPLKGPTQSGLASDLKLSIGYVHTVLKKLLDQQYVFRERDKWYVADREGLLTAWANAYSFSLNTITSTLYTPESPEDFARRLDQYCSQKAINYALTLFAAARYRAPFVSYPRLHAYFSGDIEDLIENLGLRIVSPGANIILVSPYDEGVYDGSQRLEDCRIISDVQLYLDLVNFGGRGEDQAAELASEKIKHLLSQPSVDEQFRLREFLQLRDSAFASFSNKDYKAAALYYERALEQVPGKWDGNTEMHKTAAGILYWQSLVGAAFYELKREHKLWNEYFKKAQTLYKDYQDVWPVVEQARFPQGTVFLTLLRLSILIWLIEKDPIKRKALEEQIQKYSKLATSPYTMQPEETSVQEAMKVFNSLRDEELPA